MEEKRKKEKGEEKKERPRGTREKSFYLSRVV